MTTEMRSTVMMSLVYYRQWAIHSAINCTCVHACTTGYMCEYIRQMYTTVHKTHTQYHNSMCIYIVHGSKIWLCCKKLTYFAYQLKRTTFQPIIYRSWSRLYWCHMCWLRFWQGNLDVDGRQVPSLCSW